MGMVDFSRLVFSWLVDGWRAFRLWLQIDCVDLSAAFAYHALQSALPILLIVLALAGRLLGANAELQARLIVLVAEILPGQVAAIVTLILERLSAQTVGAGLTGLLALALTASNAYLTLQRGADRLWWGRPHAFAHLSFWQLVARYVALRAKALGLVVIFACILVLDQLLIRWGLWRVDPLQVFLGGLLPAPFVGYGLWRWSLQVLLSFAIGFLACWLLLWLLPSRRISWRALLPGALVISVAITGLNVLLGRVLLLLGLRFQAYGVVGGVLILTFWVWMVGAIIYYGQCLCVVHQRRRLRKPLLLLKGRS